VAGEPTRGAGAEDARPLRHPGGLGEAASGGDDGKAELNSGGLKRQRGLAEGGKQGPLLNKPVACWWG